MNAIIKKLEVVQSEANWRKMPLTVLDEHFVKPILRLSEEDTILLVTSLSQQTFDWFRKKLWTVQDVPEDLDGYNQTIPIMTVLKRILLFRIPVTDNAVERSSLMQQLAHASLILSPTLIANALPHNDGEEEQDDDEEEGDEEDEAEEEDEDEDEE
jgi:hypothetical protein